MRDPVPHPAPRAHRLIVALAFALAGAFAQPALALELEGQPIAASAHVAGHDLQLNGAGIRAYSIYKMYVAALYLPKKTSSAAEVVGQQGAKRVQLRILLTVPGSSGYLADAFTGGIRKRVTPAQYEAMKTRLETFDKMVRGLDVKKGDVVNLDFVPDTGLTVTLNEKPVGSPIPGADLYDSMLKIWVADDAKDKPLRAAMLGGTPG
jgi:hypothetical protein